MFPNLLTFYFNYRICGDTSDKIDIDNYSKITAIGGTNGHPDYFKVEYKDGIWETYGNSADSVNSKNLLSNNYNRVLSWELSKRSDSANNKIIYQYLSDSNGHRLNTADFAFGVAALAMRILNLIMSYVTILLVAI